MAKEAKKKNLWIFILIFASVFLIILNIQKTSALQCDPSMEEVVTSNEYYDVKTCGDSCSSEPWEPTNCQECFDLIQDTRTSFITSCIEHNRDPKIFFSVPLSGCGLFAYRAVRCWKVFPKISMQDMNNFSSILNNATNLNCDAWCNNKYPADAEYKPVCLATDSDHESPVIGTPNYGYLLFINSRSFYQSADGCLTSMIYTPQDYYFSTHCYCLGCNRFKGNCDSNFDNGCESDLLTDNQNCGTCNHDCGSGYSCSNGNCVPNVNHDCSIIDVLSITPDCPIENNKYKCDETSKIDMTIEVIGSGCSYFNKARINIWSPVASMNTRLINFQYNPSGQQNFYFYPNETYFTYDNLMNLFDTGYPYICGNPDFGFCNPWDISSITILDNSGSSATINAQYNYDPYWYPYHQYNLSEYPINFSSEIYQQPPPQETGCEVYNAKLNSSFCTGDLDVYGRKKCLPGDNVTLNLTVNKTCMTFNFRDIGSIKTSLTEVSSEPELPQNLCSIQNINYSYPKCTAINQYNFTCLANWTIEDNLDEKCFGKLVRGTYLEIYNSTSWNQQNWLASKSGNFGNFTFNLSSQQQPPQEAVCKIYDAEIIPYCSSGDPNKCENTEKIQVNVTVNKTCLDSGFDQITGSTKTFLTALNYEGISGQCFYYMNASYPICSIIPFSYSQNFTCLANWTVEVPEICSEQIVKTKYIQIYNSTTQNIGNSLTYINGDFGRFTFGLYQQTPVQYNLTINTCRDSDASPDGICDSTAIHGDIYLNQTLLGQAPKSKNIAEGTYNISFKDIIGWHAPAYLIKYMPPNASITGVYAQNNLASAYLFINAKNSTGSYIDATITLKDPGTVKFSDNKLEYVYTGQYPKTFQIEFESVSGYNKPQNDEITITGNGAYILDYVYSGSGIGTCSDGTRRGSCQTAPPYKYCNSEGELVACSVYNCCGLFGLGCHEETGTCRETGNPIECNTKNSGSSCQTTALWYCYWDKPDAIPGSSPAIFCKHCTNSEQKPSTCQDYNNKSACEIDRCYVSGTGCPAGAICSCEWSDLLKTCSQKITSTSDSLPGSGSCCTYNITYGTCQNGCKGTPNSRTKLITCQGSCTANDHCDVTPGNPNAYQNCTLTDNQYTKEDCLDCGFAQGKLPFFMPWQIMIVVVLLAVYYFFLIKNNKLKKAN